MVVVIAVVGALLIVVIALVAVGGVVDRLRREPPRQIFEGDEALEFVAQALPDDVTAQLSYDDVTRILRLNLDYLHERGIARSAGDLDPAAELTVIEPDDAVRYVVARAALVDFHPEPDHVRQVITAQLAYFEAIGAVAEIDDDADTDPRPDQT